MFFPILSAGITTLGAGAFIMLSLFHLGVASNILFIIAAVCFALGPVVFLLYVLSTLSLEFLVSEIDYRYRLSPATAPAAYAPATLYGATEWVPEGLRRERIGPLNRSTGRLRRRQAA
jgi:hypothetical protein